MSSAELEEQKKAVLPFMQRAQEMQSADPKVAYYCRMYGVEQALKFDKRAKEINGLVGAALAQMEKDKPRLGLDKENDRYHCEALAVKVFANADKVDRAGRSDLGTAKTFLAASYFIEILNHFGPLDGDLVEKQKYAAWRAAEIRKAVREGRPPVPPAGVSGNGAGGGAEDLPPAYGGATGQAGEDLPAAYGGSGAGSFRSAGSYAPAPPDGAAGLPQAPAAPPPQPWGAAGGPYAAEVGPAPDLGPGGWAAPASPAAHLHTQRFKTGSKVLFMAEGVQQPEHATVGQVLSGLDGSCQYRLALRDRLEVVSDDGKCLAPDLSEGDSVVFLAARGGPAPAHTVLVNDMSWPPSYLVKLLDGMEVAAAADQLSLLEPWAAAGGGAPMGFGPSDSRFVAASAPPPAQPASGYPSITPPQPTPLSQSRPAPPAAPPPPYSGQPWSGQQAPAHAPSAALPPSYAPPPPVHLPPGHKPSVQAILDAQKNAKYAVSSLNFEDVPAAVKYLQNALRALTAPH